MKSQGKYCRDIIEQQHSMPLLGAVWKQLYQNTETSERRWFSGLDAS
jgi:hypothetical protein